MRTLCLAISLCLTSAPLIALGRTGRTGVQHATPAILSDAAEYQIYSEVIAHFFSDASGKIASDPILISNHTPAQLGTAKSAAQKSIMDRSLIGRFNEALEQETLEDYEKNLAAVVFFQARFSPRLHVVLLSDTDRGRLFSQGSDGSSPFFRQHPPSQGIVTLSRIGFNSRRTQALVSVDYFCGVMCANDQMFLLVKSGSAWKVQTAIPSPVA